MKRATVLLGLTLGLAALAGLAQSGNAPSPADLLAIRDAVADFHDADAALAAGYETFMDCMDAPEGAQGQHLTNGALIEDPALDPLRPEALLYEPTPDGGLRLVGVEYLVFQAAWQAAGHDAAPTLFGEEFHLNTTLLDEPFYALHLWLELHNPSGLFAHWNPLVRC